MAVISERAVNQAPTELCAEAVIVAGAPAFKRLLSIWVGSFSLFLSFYLLTAALPVYADSLGISQTMIGMIVGVLSLTSTLIKPWTGWATDRIGRKPLMTAGALIFAVCSTSYGACTTAMSLLAVRSLHGIGMGLYPTAAVAMATDVTPAERRGELLGLLGAGTNLAMALGPLSGMAFARAFGFGALSALSAVTALVAFVVALFLSETLSKKADRPFRLRSSLNTRALPPAVISFCLLTTFGLQLAFVPIHAERHGVNGGTFFLALALVVAVVRTLGGKLSDRYGRPYVAAAGSILAMSSLLVLAGRTDLVGVLLAGTLYGLGFGLAHSALMAWSVDRVDEQERGQALSTYLIAFDLGFALGAGGSGFAVGALGAAGAFLVAAGVALLAGALAILYGAFGQQTRHAAARE